MTKRKTIMILLFIAIFSLFKINVYAADDICYYMGQEVFVRVPSRYFVVANHERYYRNNYQKCGDWVIGYLGLRLNEYRAMYQDCINNLSFSVEADLDYYLVPTVGKKAVMYNGFSTAEGYGYYSETENIDQDGCYPYVCIYSVIERKNGLNIEFWNANNQFKYGGYAFKTTQQIQKYKDNFDYNSRAHEYYTSLGAWKHTRSNVYCANLTDSQTYWGGYLGTSPVIGEKTEGCELIDEGIRDIFNDILMYVRIIVPLMIIGFSTYEFAKGVAEGEDEMKKAQKRFVQRLGIGLAVFLIPIFINMVFDLAEIVWENTGLYSCDINGNEVGK